MFKFFGLTFGEMLDRKLMSEAVDGSEGGGGGAAGDDTGGEGEDGEGQGGGGGDGDPSTILGGEGESEDKGDGEDGESEGDGADSKEDEDKDDKPEGAPEKYELSLPEGVELSDEAMAKVEPLFRDLNLNNEQASKLASAHAELLQDAAQSFAQAQQQEHVEKLTGWYNDMTKDSEYGGQNVKESFETARKVIAHFGGDDVKGIRQAFEETGAGNNPEIMRLMVRIGKAMAEDNLAIKNAGGKTDVDLYPNSPELK